MAKKVKYQYEGPPAYIVELERHVQSGDIVEGSPALGCAAGFTAIEPEPKSKAKTQPVSSEVDS